MGGGKKIPEELLNPPEADLSPEEADAEIKRFFEQIEEELKDVPQSVIEEGAHRVVDFLKGELSWAEIFNIPVETLQQIAEFGYMQYQAGRMEEAERFFKVLTMLNWNNSHFHSMLGVVYQQQKRPGEAITEYTQALETNPDDGLSLTNRAQIFLQYGWFEQARNDLVQALAIAVTGEQKWRARAKGLQGRLQQLEAKRSGKAPAVKSGGKGKKGK